MRKKLFILFILMLAIPIIYAESEEVNLNINIEVDNNILKVTADGLDYERNLTFDGTNLDEFETDREIKKIYNFTCNTDEYFLQVLRKMDNISQSYDTLNDDMNYYNLYADCHANKSILANYQKDNEGYKARYDGCNMQLQNFIVSEQINKLELLKINQTLTATNEDLKNSKGWTTISLIAMIISLGLAWNFWHKFKKPFGKRAENPSTQTTAGMNPK